MDTFELLLMAILDNVIDKLSNSLIKYRVVVGIDHVGRLHSDVPVRKKKCSFLIGNLPDRLDRMAHVRAPTLVMVGEQDGPFLDGSRALARTIPGAELAVIPEAGHSPQREAPDAWWEAFSRFLAASTATG